MTDLALTPCLRRPCGSFADGHDMHHIRARLTGEAPWGWRDTTVVAVDGHWLHLAYVHDADEPRVWHHATLEPLVAAAPVRLHERFRVLASPAGWVSVAVRGGAGPVPEPADPVLWAAERSPGVVDLATGCALPLDHDPRPLT